MEKWSLRHATIISLLDSGFSVRLAQLSVGHPHNFEGIIIIIIIIIFITENCQTAVTVTI